MPNSFSPFGFVKKSGDVMTGDLNLGLNSLILNDGIKGGRLRGSPTSADRLEPRNIADTSNGDLSIRALTMTYNLTMNPLKTVDGVDISEIHQAKIKTGTYTGNNVDNRNIDIGVDLASKSTVYIIIKSITTHKGFHRVEYGQGDLTMYFDNVADVLDGIQTLTATGFQIGIHSQVNAEDILYRYIVFWEE